MDPGCLGESWIEEPRGTTIGDLPESLERVPPVVTHIDTDGTQYTIPKGEVN
jgi:hypothetical protein